MKRNINFLAIPVVLIGLASCSSIQPTMDNNVYMMKTSNLPIGEDLVDETSYSTFKYRAENGNPASDYYNSGNSTALSSGFTMQKLDFNGRFSSWNSFNPYFGMHRDGHYIGGGLYVFNNFYPQAMYGFMGSSYGNSFGNYYGVSPYYGCGPFYGTSSGGFYNTYYGYNGPNGSNHNPMNNSNVYYSVSPKRISAPRATVGGTYSGNNKGGTIKTKSLDNSGNTAVSRRGATTTSGQSINNTYVTRNTGAAPTYTRSGSNPPIRSANSTYSGTNRNVTTTRSTSNSNSPTSRPSSGVSVNSGSNSGGSQRSSSGVSTSGGGSSSGSSSRSGGRGL